MVRIAVFSDTHGSINKCIDAVNKLGKVDMIIHLGDIVQDAVRLSSVFSEIPVEYVAGNNDMYSAELEKMIEAEGKRIFITHGHIYRVKSGLSELCDEAKNQKADMCLFGHTHVPYDGCEYGVRLLNPGSASRYCVDTTCGIIEIDDKRIKSMIWNI